MPCDHQGNTAVGAVVGALTVCEKSVVGYTAKCTEVMNLSPRVALGKAGHLCEHGTEGSRAERCVSREAIHAVLCSLINKRGHERGTCTRQTQRSASRPG